MMEPAGHVNPASQVGLLQQVASSHVPVLHVIPSGLSLSEPAVQA
jgi:hypothetical protein